MVWNTVQIEEKVARVRFRRWTKVRRKSRLAIWQLTNSALNLMRNRIEKRESAPD
jgi:hypothetical protein